MGSRSVIRWVVVLTISVPASAATYPELLAKARAGFAHAEKAGKRPAPLPQPDKPHVPTAEERERGFVVYLPPIEQPFTGRGPAVGEARKRIDLRVCRGETTSFLLGLHALQPQQGLLWSLTGPMPSGVRVEFLPVVMAPLAHRRSDKYSTVGLWLGDVGAVDIQAGQSRAWLVRIGIGPDVGPGNYGLALPSLVSKTSRWMRAGPRIGIRVLPFRLADPWERGYVFGAFCGGADFSEAQYREMKAHGIESILWFWGHYGLDIRNENGKLRVGFADLDRTVDRLKKAGLRGPIVLALGNDHSGHFERAICGAFDLPRQPEVNRDGKPIRMAVLDDPRIERRMVEAFQQLFDHARANDWPEIVILPYDEPTERLMNEHKRMVRLFRKHFPKVRLYGVTMDRLKWAEMVLDTDILVTNGDWARIRTLAAEQKKQMWCYGSVGTSHGYAGCRWRYGLRPYAFGPDGMWFWCYNFHVADPWNEFDGFTPDSSWVIRWPPLTEDGPSTETLAYEGLREAVTDVRYAITLEAVLAARKDAKAEQVRTAYAAWRKGLQGAAPPSRVADLRERLLEWLLELQ